MNHFACFQVNVTPLRPVQRLTQADSNRVEPDDRSVHVNAQRFLGLRGAGHTNPVFSKVGVDSQWKGGICIDQFVTPNRSEPKTKTYVLQPIGLGRQVDFDTAHGFPVDQLRKCRGEELVHPREGFHPVAATTPSDIPSKSGHGQIGHERRKHELASLKACPSRRRVKGQKSDARRSNRDQTVTRHAASKSSTDHVLM